MPNARSWGFTNIDEVKVRMTQAQAAVAPGLGCLLLANLLTARLLPPAIVLSSAAGRGHAVEGGSRLAAVHA